MNQKDGYGNGVGSGDRYKCGSGSGYGDGCGFRNESGES